MKKDDDDYGVIDFNLYEWMNYLTRDVPLFANEWAGPILTQMMFM